MRYVRKRRAIRASGGTNPAVDLLRLRGVLAHKAEHRVAARHNPRASCTAIRYGSRRLLCRLCRRWLCLQRDHVAVIRRQSLLILLAKFMHPHPQVMHLGLFPEVRRKRVKHRQHRARRDHRYHAPGFHRQRRHIRSIDSSARPLQPPVRRKSGPMLVTMLVP